MTSGELGAWFGREVAPALEAGTAADLEIAAEAALRAGAEIGRLYAREGADAVGVEDKGGGDPVTEADHAANRAIAGVLRERASDDPVLSEESDPPPSAERRGRLWVVDPLDGTQEFLDRNGEFCAMVGLARDGSSRLGALHRPDPGILYLGVAAKGAWEVRDPGGEARIRKLAVESGRARAVRLIHSRSHFDERLERLVGELGPVKLRPHGSSGLKCALVAAGEADLYVHPVPHLKEWDTCAPEAVLLGAGGRVTDCRGEPLRYGKEDLRQRGGILAARPDVWARVAPLVREFAPSGAEG